MTVLIVCQYRRTQVTNLSSVIWCSNTSAGSTPCLIANAVRCGLTMRTEVHACRLEFFSVAHANQRIRHNYHHFVFPEWQNAPKALDDAEWRGSRDEKTYDRHNFQWPNWTAHNTHFKVTPNSTLSRTSLTVRYRHILRPPTYFR